MEPDMHMLKKYLNRFYKVENGFTYERNTNKAKPLAPKVIEEVLQRVFSLDNDIIYITLYQWLYTNGVEDIRRHWDGFVLDLSMPDIATEMVESYQRLISETLANRMNTPITNGMRDYNVPSYIQPTYGDYMLQHINYTPPPMPSFVNIAL